MLALITGSMTLGAVENGRLIAASTSRDPLADLESRSPGSRLWGTATSEKIAISREFSSPKPALEGESQQPSLDKIFYAPIKSESPRELLFGDEAAAVFSISELAKLSDSLVSAGNWPGASFPRGGDGAIGAPGVYVGDGGEETSGAGDNPPVAAVPEPDAWALMILGFAGVGAALRRQSRKVASWRQH